MSDFNDVKDFKLRAFNRAQVAHNLLEDCGEVSCKRYLEQFSGSDRTAVMFLFSYMAKATKDEVDNVRRMIQRSVEPELKVVE